MIRCNRSRSSASLEAPATSHKNPSPASACPPPLQLLRSLARTLQNHGACRPCKPATQLRLLLHATESPPPRPQYNPCNKPHEPVPRTSTCSALQNPLLRDRSKIPATSHRNRSPAPDPARTPLPLLLVHHALSSSPAPTHSHSRAPITLQNAAPAPPRPPHTAVSKRVTNTSPQEQISTKLHRHV